MQRAVVLSLSALALSLAAHGTTITCTVSPTQIPNGTGTASLSCPSIDAGSGFIIGSLQLLLASDYINGPFGASSGTTVSVVYTPAANFGAHTQAVTGGFSSTSSTTDGNPDSGGGPFLAETIFVNSQTLAGFTIQESSSVSAGGPVSASTVNAFLSYTASSPVPEPATLGLAGGALLALGCFARRKTKA